MISMLRDKKVRPEIVNLVKQETGNVAARHFVSKSR